MNAETKAAIKRWGVTNLWYAAMFIIFANLALGAYLTYAGNFNRDPLLQIIDVVIGVFLVFSSIVLIRISGILWRMR